MWGDFTKELSKYQMDWGKEQNEIAPNILYYRVTETSEVLRL